MTGSASLHIFPLTQQGSSSNLLLRADGYLCYMVHLL